MRVFVAYSSLDATEVASALDAWRNGTAASWWPIEQIQRRDDWAEIAEELIRQADAFLFATTPSSVNSEPCLWELATARWMGRPCWQWVLQDVPEQQVPAEVKDLPVVGVGLRVDAATWFG